MEHAEVEKSLAVERYILNEMSEDERGLFEEHYFDCRVCAAEVTMGTHLLDNGRAIAREMGTVVPIDSRRRWTTWLPIASAAVLTILLVALLLPRRTEPSLDMIEPHLIAAGENRAGGDAMPALRAGEPSLLFVDVQQPDPPLPRYEILIRDSAGKVRVRRPVTADQASQTIYLLLRSLPAGNYVLTIEGVREGGNRTEIDRKQFRVQ